MPPVRTGEFTAGAVGHKEKSPRFGKVKDMYLKGHGAGYNDGGLRPRRLEYYNHFPIGGRGASQSHLTGSLRS